MMSTLDKTVSPNKPLDSLISYNFRGWRNGGGYLFVAAPSRRRVMLLPFLWLVSSSSS
jgi:hypothetical protein